VSRYTTPYCCVSTANAIAADNAGRVYVTGQAAFGSTASKYGTIAYDSTTGTELWVDLYSGNNDGYGSDHATGIALDGAGNIYVTGQSESPRDTGQSWLEYATLKYTHP
jgi:hypothetical protein